MMIHMGSIPKPTYRVMKGINAPSWYFKGKSFPIELSNTTIYIDHCSYNDDVTFVRIEECDDSLWMRKEAEKYLGEEISWFAPAPVPRWRIELVPAFIVGLIMVLTGK